MVNAALPKMDAPFLAHVWSRHQGWPPQHSPREAATGRVSWLWQSGQEGGADRHSYSAR